jgi:hypothetical protein
MLVGVGGARVSRSVDAVGLGPLVPGRYPRISSGAKRGQQGMRLSLPAHSRYPRRICSGLVATLLEGLD